MLKLMAIVVMIYRRRARQPHEADAALTLNPQPRMRWYS
jgi:hypothetical protein